MTHPQYKRRIKLILPGLQLRLTGRFVGLAALAMMLQFIILGYRLVDRLAGFEGGPGDLAAHVPGLLIETMLLSMLVVLPLMTAFGVLFTFRIAGPAYRFQQYLGSIARGEEMGPCRIRKADEMQFLCDAVNAAAARIQGTPDSTSAEEAETPATAPAEAA